jgi:hypothetical protein
MSDDEQNYEKNHSSMSDDSPNNPKNDNSKRTYNSSDNE